jgi:hypothetical protein
MNIGKAIWHYCERMSDTINQISHNHITDSNRNNLLIGTCFGHHIQIWIRCTLLKCYPNWAGLAGELQSLTLQSGFCRVLTWTSQPHLHQLHRMCYFILDVLKLLSSFESGYWIQHRQTCKGSWNHDLFDS